MSSRALQHGGFLLEALISILIFSFGVLGLVGLQASAIQYTNDAQYRAEAGYFANTLIARMWSDDRTQLTTKYAMPPGSGVGYDQMKSEIDNVVTGLPGAAALAAPSSLEIFFNETAPDTATSVNVRVVVHWKPPGDPAGTVHNFETTATIGLNQ